MSNDKKLSDEIYKLLSEIKFHCPYCKDVMISTQKYYLTDCGYSRLEYCEKCDIVFYFCSYQDCKEEKSELLETVKEEIKGLKKDV